MRGQVWRDRLCRTDLVTDGKTRRGNGGPDGSIHFVAARFLVGFAARKVAGRPVYEQGAKGAVTSWSDAG